MAERFNHRLKAGHSGAMLAGVCSRLAAMLGWNVWAVRAVLLVLLVAKPLWTIIAYAAVALLLGLVDRSRRPTGTGAVETNPAAGELRSPELASRKQRIEDLEQRFRDWERTLPKD
jgi:phage shock protein PspC (stress-responsive transcriptional regulator)